MKRPDPKCECGARAWKLRKSLDVVFCDECGIAAYANTENSRRAEHFIRCSHCLGSVRIPYTMKCVPLKIMPDKARVKICVFGNRYWRTGSERKRIRYVLIYRVRILKDET